MVEKTELTIVSEYFETAFNVAVVEKMLRARRSKNFRFGEG